MDILIELLPIVEDYRVKNGHTGIIVKIEYKDEYTILITYQSRFGYYTWSVDTQYYKDKLLFIDSNLVFC